MKFFSGLLALSAIGNLAYAAPVAEPEFDSKVDLYADNQSPHHAGIAEAQLEKRDFRSTCTIVAKYVWIGHKTLEVVDWFYTDVETYIQGVCERHNNAYCASIVTEVRAGFDLALKLTRKVDTAAALIGAGGSYLNANANNARSVDTFHPSDPYNMDLLMSLHNYTIDSHEMVKNPRIGARSEDGTPALAHHYRLNGLREMNSNVSRNYNIYHFEDGNAHLRIPGPSSGSGLNKRHDGPGVKIAFSHEATGYSASDFEGAAANFAYRWEHYAIQGHGQIFGWAGLSHKAFMYFRSITEGDGFGDNYESVTACGDMKQYVGTYIGPGAPGPM